MILIIYYIFSNQVSGIWYELGIIIFYSDEDNCKYIAFTPSCRYAIEHIPPPRMLGLD